MTRRNRLLIAGHVLLGLLLAFWLARVYFLHPPGRIHVNDEGYSYAGRLIEFRDLLAAGYVSPQWCTHFRGGLGAPYFSYYQPGFFYAASLVPWAVPPLVALGLTVAGFAMLGYLSMAGLVGRWFGRLSGALAGGGLLLSVYAGTEISFRGDLSEFAAMMTLPAVLWALAGWFEHGRRRHAVCLTVASAALITLHPAVALIGFALFALALIAFVAATRQFRRVLGAAAALGVGVGLAAFYWLPVFFEWNLVGSEAAFTGFYHYAEHFVGPLAILNPWNDHMTLPLTPGPVLVASIVLNTFVMLLRRGQEATSAVPPRPSAGEKGLEDYRLVSQPAPPGTESEGGGKSIGRSDPRCGELVVWQRRLLFFCLIAGVLCTLLMTRWSAPLWDRIDLLQRLQFPWRIVSLVTVLAAAAAGCMVPWRREPVRAVVVALSLLAMWGFALRPTSYELDPRTTVPADVEQLMRLDFRPDIRDEWLPKGASPNLPAEFRAGPMAGPGCEVDRFERTQGRLRCRVRTGGPSHVVLPHYFFPVGWQARLDGQQVALSAERHGLMRIELPDRAAGELEVTFSHTPMRRLGLWISTASLLIGGLCLWRPVWRRIASPRD